MRTHLPYKNIILLLSICLSGIPLKAQPHCKLGWQVQPYFCNMDSLILTAYAFGGADPYTYLWNTGETTVSIFALNSSGATYSVTVTGENGCTAAGSITLGINVDPYINSNTTTQCENFPIYLDAVFPFLVLAPEGVSYLWSTGATTYNITVYDPGTYTVTFTDPANGCTFTASQTVNFIPAPDPVITGPTEICGGQSITLTASGGPFLDYLWLPGGQETESITVNSPGTYIVQVLGSNFCYGYDTITITNGADITLTGVATPNSSCSNPNGSIDLSVNPPGSYTYAWSNNATTQDINNLTPGTYTVSVSSGGCTLSEEFVVVDNTIQPEASLLASPATCGLNNGGVTTTISPAGTYTYAWSNGAGTMNLSNIPGGSYSLTVTSSSGCTGVATIDVPDAVFIPAITGVAAANTSCISPNGSIAVTVTPAGTYSFLWSNGSTAEDLINLAAGSYTLTVTAGLTCSATADFMVEDQAGMPAIQSVISPDTCGMSAGSIELQISGSQAPYSLLWSNGATTSSLPNLSQGTYTVTVTGSNGCSTATSLDVPNEEIPIVLQELVTPNTSCTQSNGAIDISVSPTLSYLYHWSTGATTEDLFNIPAGDYTVTVTFGTCLETAAYTVVNSNIPFTISGISSANTSCINANGSIDVSVTPPGAYSFLWSNGMPTEDLQGLVPGAYTITVTNPEGCSLSSTYQVGDQIVLPVLTAMVSDNMSCTAPTGSIDVTVHPAGSYSYAWSNGSMAEDLTGLEAGIYTVMATDQSGCTTQQSFTVISTAQPPVFSAQITNDVCGGETGSIDLTASPSGCQYVWSSGQTDEDLSDIPEGQYAITVTSPNGCLAADTFTVANVNLNFSITSTITPDTSCLLPAGSIDLMISPAGSYQFNWSTGQVTEDLSGLPSGHYSVTVTDQANCLASLDMTVVDSTTNPVVTATLAGTTCQQPVGQIDLQVIPSAGNSFTWSNGATTEDIAGLSAGIYTVTVSGANGCETYASYELDDHSTSFSITATVEPNTSCLVADGSITLSLTPQGPYFYQWADGSQTSAIHSLMAGQYSVVITDTAGCAKQDTFWVEDQRVYPQVTLMPLPATCGHQNGSVNSTVTGTNGNLYLWSNGMAQPDLTDLPAGLYTVTVTGDNGCTATCSTEINNINSNFTITGITTGDSSCLNGTGTIDLTVLPAGTYSYSWSNGSQSEDLSGLVSGILEVTVTDQAQCSSTQVFAIENNSIPPTLTAEVKQGACGMPNGSIDLSVSPPAAYAYTWSDGSVTEDLHDLIPGIYTVTVTDRQGCTGSFTSAIANSNPLALSMVLDMSVAEVTGTVYCALTINRPETDIASTRWTPLAAATCQDSVCLEQEFHLNGRNEITVTVTDIFGCMAEARTVVDIRPAYRVYIPNVFTPNADGTNDRFTVYGNEEIEEIVLLQIYDRWGDQVFVKETFPPNDPAFGWDGMYHGQWMNPAVFAYRAVVRYTSGEEHAFRGDVTLVR